MPLIRASAAFVQMAVGSIAALIETRIASLTAPVESSISAIAVTIEASIDAVTLAIEVPGQPVVALRGGPLGAEIEAGVNSVALPVAVLLVAIATLVQASLDTIALVVEARIDPVAASVQACILAVTARLNTVGQLIRILGIRRDSGGQRQQKQCNTPFDKIHDPLLGLRLLQSLPYPTRARLGR